MDVTYKYVLESAPATKDLKVFLDDFFKNHFQEFMEMKTMLMISPSLGNNQTIFQLDIDFKQDETDSPNNEVNRVFNMLSIAFKPLTFNLEMTPNGCHIVSNFVYQRIHELKNIKNMSFSFFDRIRNLDLDASFNSIPLKRIGYDPNKNFFYAPSNENESKQSFRNSLFKKQNPYGEEYWTDYIMHKLVPVKHSISYVDFVKRLSEFESLMGGKTK